MNKTITRNWQDYRWPLFSVLGILFGALVGFTLARSYGDDFSEEFALAISLHDEQLINGNYTEAYDYLLAAARLEPSDPRLLSAVFSFIEKTAEDENSDTYVLAEDIYARADLLIPFQSVNSISDSRKKYNELSSLFKSQSVPKPDWFSDVRVLISKAADKSIEIGIRSMLVDQVRSVLDGLALQGANATLGTPVLDNYWKEVTKLTLKITEIEDDVIGELYQKERKQVGDWFSKTKKLIDRTEVVEPKEAMNIIATFNDKIQTGYRAIRKISPYATSQIGDSIEFSQKLQDRLGVLERTKSWIYNQQALRRIQAVEELQNSLGIEKLRLLSEIYEIHLSSYINHRFQKVWDEAFETCSEEDKVAAVKMRILKTGD